MIKYNILSEYDNDINHFTTERSGGVSVDKYDSFNLSPFSGDTPSAFSQNVDILCSSLEISKCNIVIPYQTHGTNIKIINKEYRSLSERAHEAYLHDVDALVTNVNQICICITTADCVPLLFFDPVRKVVGAAHAGWRGTCDRIAEKTVRAMQAHFGCLPEHIRVAVGPSISPQVYQVGDELLAKFQASHFDTTSIFIRKEQTLHLDLWEANRQSLLQAGIKIEHIETCELCTFTLHDRFFSARRLGIKSGRILSGIFIR